MIACKPQQAATKSSRRLVVFTVTRPKLSRSVTREELHNRYGPLSVQAPISDFSEMGDNATLGTNFDSDPGGTEPCDRHYTSLCVVLVLCKLVNAERQ